VAQSYLQDIPQARFTAETIREMYRLADRGKTDADFQKIVYDITNHSLPGQWKQYRRELDAIFNWFKKHHDYRRDPTNVELLQDVWATMDRKRFDCDDASIFLCAASEILGNPCRFVTVSTKLDQDPEHIFIQAYVDGQWLSMDAIFPWSTVGWEPTEGVTARKVWTRRELGLSGDEELPLEGLGMHDSNPNGWTDDYYKSNGNGHKGGNWEGGFASSWYQPPTPDGIASDVSHTYGGAGMPGEATVVKRLIPAREVNLLADPHQTERAGGGTYAPESPIRSYPTPAEVYGIMPSEDVPMPFDRDVWTGAVPDSVPDYRYLLPQPYVSSRESLTDLAGCLCEEGKRMSGLGYIGQDVIGAGAGVVAKAVEDTASEFGSSVLNMIPSLINTGVTVWQALQQKKILEEQRRLEEARAAQVAAMTAQPVTPTKANGLPSWVIPVGIGAVLLAGGGLALFSPGRKYRRNPKRKTDILPLALGAGAVYFLTKKNVVPAGAAPMQAAVMAARPPATVTLAPASMAPRPIYSM